MTILSDMSEVCNRILTYPYLTWNIRYLNLNQIPKPNLAYLSGRTLCPWTLYYPKLTLILILLSIILEYWLTTFRCQTIRMATGQSGVTGGNRGQLIFADFVTYAPCLRNRPWHLEKNKNVLALYQICLIFVDHSHYT